MEVIWLAPLAWVGAFTALAPVAVHLLTRHRAVPVPFPTLRFIHATRLATLRPQSMQEWWLLAVRVAILIAATAALAAPVFVSAERRDRWRSRVISALVVSPRAEVDRSQQEKLIATERAGSFASEVFRPSLYVADGLRDAALWLDRQRPGAREVVIVGNLRAADVSAADLALVPVDAAIRFLPLPATGFNRSMSTTVLQGASRWRADVMLLDDATRVAYSPAPADDLPIRVRAGAGDEPFAAAALDAVLARGLRVRQDRRVLAIFDGAETSDVHPLSPASAPWMRDVLAALPQVSGGQFGDTLILRVSGRADGVDALYALERVARVAFATDPSGEEPAAVAPDVLARWSRPASSGGSFHLHNEGDGRWFWGAALFLLALEAALRRTGHAEHAATEERVA